MLAEYCKGELTDTTYLAYLFWSIITSLLTTLFYFSVWKLGISGAEASIFIFLSPALLAFAPLRRWANTRSGQITLRILSLAGLAAYKLNDPVARLYVVSGANLAVMVSRSADWVSCEGAYQGLRELVVACS